MKNFSFFLVSHHSLKNTVEIGQFLLHQTLTIRSLAHTVFLMIPVFNSVTKDLFLRISED